MWLWDISGHERVERFVKLILPYSRIKREKLLLLLEYLNVHTMRRQATPHEFEIAKKIRVGRGGAWARRDDHSQP